MSVAMNRLRSTLVILILLATPSWSTPAAAQEPSPTTSDVEHRPITARAELAANSLSDEMRAGLEVELAQQLEKLAEAHGFEVSKSHTAMLLLHIDIGQTDVRNPVYLMHASVFRDGELLERAEARTCVRCTPAELVELSLELLPRALSQVAASPEEEPIEPPPPAVVADADENESDEPARARPRGPGPMTYAGLSIGALGLVGVIAGGVLVGRGIQPRPADPLHLTVINYSKPGAALLGVGLGSVVAGLVLLALDVWGVGSRHRNIALARDGLQIGVRF